MGLCSSRGGSSTPPADLRYLSRPASRLTGDYSCGRIVSFLQTIYESVAENLPDVRDDPSIEAASFRAEDKECDPHITVKLNRGTKTRKFKKGLKVHVERKPETSGLEPRWLPPGCMQDYYEQYKCMEGHQAASFSTFWRTWRTEFEHLRFRPVSSHAQCSVCLHHRVLLRELAPYLYARQHQAKLYHAHLMMQYRDRLVYWSLRGSSRLRSLGHIAIIQDGMDQCKFAFPRTQLCRGKDLATLIRPKLGIVGIIAHGFGVAFTVSNPQHAKDSSCMAEIFCHMLTRLERQGVRLSDTVIHLLADNTSRETKNSTTLRLLCCLVQQRDWFSIQCKTSFCSSYG